MGDFNAIIDPDLDNKGGIYKIPKQNKLINTVRELYYTDTFRELNPDGEKYTWSNKRDDGSRIMTRIDYIWSDVNWSFDILGCDIKDAHLIIDSDHNIVTSHFNTNNIIRNHKISKRNRKKGKITRRIFKYDNIS